MTPISHLQPLVNRLKRVIARRFRAQARFYRLHNRLSTDTSFAAGYERITYAAYIAGAQMAHQALAKAQEAKRKTLLPAAVYTALPHGVKGPDQLAAELDTTTAGELADIIDAGSVAGLLHSDVMQQIAAQFRDWAGDRAATAAEYETSSAYHIGAQDAARIIGQQQGVEVEKAWDVEDGACEVCLGNVDDGWIPIDILFASGDDAPTAHPHCVCSLSYRTGAAIEEAQFAEDYNPDQERDEHGRWVSTGTHETGIRLGHSDKRAYSGEQTSGGEKLSKLETGALGEKIILEHLKLEGYTDAHPLNAKVNNFPVDGVQDHELIEMKTGLSTNGSTAQQWRATIGQPGPTETAWLKTASKEDKAAWNAGKQQEILDRKNAAVDNLARETGHSVAGSTMTVIINPSTHTADIYKFNGFHSRIAWNSAQAKAGYIRSVTYGKI
jgi:hypothetical protein